jgi:hypothetical protein
VYVRTADGERVIGSWQAGSPEEAIAFYARKYEALETEVVLLEQWIASTDMAPAQASPIVHRLLQHIIDADALGDLEGLRARLEQLTGDVGYRYEEARTAREQARVQAREIKERIVAEAEQISAEATHWKSSGERMRELLEEWKAAPHADRVAEAMLWKRLSSARGTFTKRRKAYYANLEAEREHVRVRKVQLVADAEMLSSSTDWGSTANAFSELMRQWKAAGRTDRDSEAELWRQFRAAQDRFFTSRAEAFPREETESRQRTREVQVTVYISDGQDAEAVEEAIEGVLESFGMEITVLQDPISGSWYRELMARTKEAVTARELQNQLAKLKRELEMQVLCREQAQVAIAQGPAVAQLISSLDNTSNATIKIGSVLLTKVDGVLTVRSLSSIEVARLEQHPDLFWAPASVLDELKVTKTNHANSATDLSTRRRWRWDVALSFASAQRDYVGQVAQALTTRGLRCFHDADDQIELWGKYLAEELPNVYGEQAAVVVIFVSAEYAARDWTRLERRTALARAARERREYVLPARFDDTPLPGLLSDMNSGCHETEYFCTGPYVANGCRRSSNHSCRSDGDAPNAEYAPSVDSEFSWTVQRRTASYGRCAASRAKGWSPCDPAEAQWSPRRLRRS